MTQQEIINQTLQQQIDSQNSRIDNTLIKVDAIIEEIRDFKNEMRQQNQMRAEEVRELRQEMNNMQAQFYAKIDNMDSKIDGIGKHVQNLTVAAIVGIGAAVIGIGAIAVAVIYSVFSH